MPCANIYNTNYMIFRVPPIQISAFLVSKLCPKFNVFIETPIGIGFKKRKEVSIIIKFLLYVLANRLLIR
jgi:hypothetical protein